MWRLSNNTATYNTKDDSPNARLPDGFSGRLTGGCYLREVIDMAAAAITVLSARRRPRPPPPPPPPPPLKRACPWPAE